MTQRPGLTEEVCLSLRDYHDQEKQARADGVVTPLEDAMLDRQYEFTMRLARLSNLCASRGFRLMRTGRDDKNLRGEQIRLEREVAEQTEGRLLDFPTAAQRKRRSGSDPNSAA